MSNLSNVSKNGNTKEFTLSGSLIVLFLASEKYHSHANTNWTNVIAILWMKTILLFQVRQLPNFWRQHRYLVIIEISDLKQRLQILWMKTILPRQLCQFPYFGWHHCNTIFGKAQTVETLSKTSIKKYNLLVQILKKPKFFRNLRQVVVCEIDPAINVTTNHVTLTTLPLDGSFVLNITQATRNLVIPKFSIA